MVASSKYICEPLKYSGTLDSYDFFEVTPCLGREYNNLSIRDMLNAPNSDDMIRDFAVIVSTRLVVFLRSGNDDLTLKEQKTFTQKLGILTGKPEESGLHCHPSSAARLDEVVHEEAQADREAFLVSNRLQKKIYDRSTLEADAKKNQNGSRAWHTEYPSQFLPDSSIMYETVPSDYSCLQMHIQPPSGGDTLWASGVEMYNRYSTKMQNFLKTLTITSSQQTFTSAAEKGGFTVVEENRGHPSNRGTHFTATHPVVRTNPVTGLNSSYAVGLHVKCVDGITNAESEALIKSFLDCLTQNHDLQVRLRWTPKTVAVWDNRSVNKTQL